MNNVYAKIVDSMQKVFPGQEPAGEERRKTVLQNERLNFQLVYKNDFPYTISNASIEVKGGLAAYITVRAVELVPAMYFPVKGADDYVLSANPGLFPDVLKPTGKLGAVLPSAQWKAFWVSAENKEGFAPGKYKTEFILRGKDGGILSRLVYETEVLPIAARETDLKVTNWFHYDAIAAKHGVSLFSDGFYAVFEGYLREYVRAGNNMILTPLFTPPLDTEVGGERRTAQLIGVKKQAQGYRFDFSALIKFVSFVTERGIKYIEFSHLFTQWGGQCCPKIIAENESGEKQKIFGWETASDSKEYLSFLNEFLPSLVREIDRNGWRGRCYFHLTDEPSAEHLHRYKFLRDFVKERIGDLPVMDAISHYEFYEEGGVDVPVPVTSAYDNFADKGIKELFVYYCCVPYDKYYSNRFLNMPLHRVKILGAQLYETGVQGFLHWGFNFYNTARSVEEIDPYADTSAGALFPAGDSFVVYPAENDAYASNRSEALGEGFFEYRVLKTLEAYAGRKKTLKILHDYGICGYNAYPKNAAVHKELREKIYAVLKNYAKKQAKQERMI